MEHNAQNIKMEHMNHSSMGHNNYNSMGYMNQTNIGHMFHMNQSSMESMGHMNHSDEENMGHMNHSDMEHMGHEHMGQMDHGMHDMGYKPFFTTKTSAAMFFQQWPTDTQVGIVTALIASVVIAVVLECLQEYSRIVFLRISARKTGSGRFGTDLYGCFEKLFMSALMMIRVVAGYLLMLSVMTMNVWIMICVCLGATLGYGLGKPIVAIVVYKKSLPVKQKELESILLKDIKGEMLNPSPDATYKSTTSKSMSKTGINEEGMPMVQGK